MKRVLEKFLMDEAYDPASLDFYRVESRVCLIQLLSTGQVLYISLGN